MKTIKKTTLQSIVLTSCLSWSAMALAGSNQLQNISINNGSAGKVEVLLSFNSPVAIPKGFVLQNPPRLVFDFPGVDVAPTARKNHTQRGVINAVQAAGNKGQTRLVFNLDTFVDYTAELTGNDLVLLFNAGKGQGATRPAHFASQPAPAIAARPTQATESYDWYKAPSAKGGSAPVQKRVAAPPVELAEVPLPEMVTKPMVHVPSLPPSPVPVAQPARPPAAVAYAQTVAAVPVMQAAPRAVAQVTPAVRTARPVRQQTARFHSSRSMPCVLSISGVKRMAVDV